MLSLTVGQAATHIKSLLESDPILTDIWIEGEISNLSRPSSGHVYFSLKDQTAQIRCAFFRQWTTPLALAAVDHGAQVLVHGNISFYEVRGDLQLYVDAVQPAGLGVLAAEFERLLAQLESEGLFALGRKRPLPPFPRTIAVLTSPSGAVLHDICTVLERRWPLVSVLVVPTLVQGDGAAEGIVRGITLLNRRDDVDVIIVARGGGSLEDLWAFNDERVARAIFGSRIPIVSAVGHETDFTIADYVADLRAPTPSAAAELVVPDQVQVALRVAASAQRLDRLARSVLDGGRLTINRAARTLERVRPDPAGLAINVSAIRRGMGQVISHELEIRAGRLEGREGQLAVLSPLSTLERGYALVQTREGAIVARAAEAHTGESIRVRMADGSFGARVEPNGSQPRSIKPRPEPAAAEQSRLL